MRPGQIEPNELELALLSRFAAVQPAVARHLANLRVLSREFTGVGCFTNFAGATGPASGERAGVDWRGVVQVPDVPGGLGAVLFCQGDQPVCLEVYTFGEVHWDGRIEGFRIEDPD